MAILSFISVEPHPHYISQSRCSKLFYSKNHQTHHRFLLLAGISLYWWDQDTLLNLIFSILRFPFLPIFSHNKAKSIILPCYNSFLHFLSYSLPSISSGTSLQQCFSLLYILNISSLTSCFLFLNVLYLTYPKNILPEYIAVS